MNGVSLPPFRVVQWILGSVILAVLLLVAYGNLVGNREASLRLAESRNLQQWGIALNLYLIENENQLPDVGSTPVSADQKRAWYNVLPPYVSETPLAELPPGERPRPGVPSFWIRPSSKPVKIWDPEVFFFNYGMNRFLQPVEGTRSFRIFEINFPGNVIFLAPVSDYSPAATPDAVDFGKDPKTGPAVLFCGGHVQPVPRDVLLATETLAAPTSPSSLSWFRQ